VTEESKPLAPTPADEFRSLADKIERNRPEDFGGAFLIIPPEGDPVSGILVGSVDLVTFWSLLKSKMDNAIADADNKNKINRAFR
jgi:hypothetical protein